MQWRIYVPGRDPLDYWVYTLEAYGVTHTTSFEVEVVTDQR